MSKQSDTNELMLAIEQMLIKNLNASILEHGQMMNDGSEADFTAIIDSKKYNITIEQMENDND
tara:strand:- start:277 stop:465 length:189 start_codon:yes stop_codon:yes gene_type:complete